MGKEEKKTHDGLIIKIQGRRGIMEKLRKEETLPQIRESQCGQARF